jgi:hypothetical protein
VTPEKFGKLVADLWRARQRWAAARKKLDKTGLVIKRRGQWRAAPAVADYCAQGKEIKRLLAALGSA